MFSRSLLATLACALLTACASDPQVVAVKTPIAEAPAACRRAPKDLPRLPDREITTAELARRYNALQAQYLREAGRARLCQRYVQRIAQ